MFHGKAGVERICRRRSALIDMDKDQCDPKSGDLPASHGDTNLPFVIDREGNIVSLIQSLYLRSDQE